MGDTANDLIDRIASLQDENGCWIVLWPADGGYRTPRSYPYFGNKSCYGSHTCYWGVVKLLKGLVHIPKNERSRDANELIEKAVDFILLHQVCFGSRSSEKLLHPAMGILTFPNMYHSDFLETLWLLTKAGIRSPRMDKATRMLREKMDANGRWTIDKPVTGLIVPMGRKSMANDYISERAREVLAHQGNPER